MLAPSLKQAAFDADKGAKDPAPRVPILRRMPPATTGHARKHAWPAHMRAGAGVRPPFYESLVLLKGKESNPL